MKKIKSKPIEVVHKETRLKKIISIFSSSWGKKILFFLVVLVTLHLFTTSIYLFPDGQQYFAYLPSLFYDHDIHFYNDFVHLRFSMPIAFSKTDYVVNIASFGTPFFWTPFYLLGMGVDYLDDGVIDNPYSGLFWRYVNFSTMVYGIIALLFMVDILKMLNLNKSSLLFVILTFFGTPMFFYTFIIPCVSHGVSAFAVTLYLWFWIKTMKVKNNIFRYILLGLGTGFIAMIRPQEVVFAVCLGIEWLHRLFIERENILKIIPQTAVFVISSIVGFSPQMILWKFLYGGYLSAPARFNLSRDYFSLIETLFSSYHGLFY